MPYLIDGHNVIGQMPRLSLDDPDDEAKLVLLVRSLCAREKRSATLIFDGGLPGGVSNLSSSNLMVVFASDRHTSADDLILKRIAAEPNPQGLIVVTSDQRLVNAAKQRRASVLRSAEFARLLARPAPAAAPEKERGPSADEISKWEALFKNRGVE